MKKELSEMTLAELWELFPIYLTAPDPNWNKQYCEEENLLTSCLPYVSKIRISHIGSTAIDNIWAKPIVDILVEIPEDLSMGTYKEVLLLNNYLCHHEERDRMDFNKGYTKDGFADKVFHLHLRFIGDNDELYFRDYLNQHEEVAKEYEKLKLSLWPQYEHDRDGYTNAKGEFIQKYTIIGKREDPNKYVNLKGEQ